MLDVNPRATLGGNKPPALDAILKDRYADLFKRTKAILTKLKGAPLTPQTKDDCASLNKIVADAKALLKEADDIRAAEKDEFLRAGKVVDGVFNGEVRDTLKDPLQKVADAAASRLLAITREEQKIAAAEAEKAAAEANKRAAEAAAAEAKGNIHTADLKMNQAAAAQDTADALAADANRDERQASKSTIGGVTQSVTGKLVCTGVNKAELDWATLAPFIKEEALVDAVNRYLGMGNASLKGAVIIEKAVGFVRR